MRPVSSSAQLMSIAIDGDEPAIGRGEGDRLWIEESESASFELDELKPALP